MITCKKLEKFVCVRLFNEKFMVIDHNINAFYVLCQQASFYRGSAILEKM